MAKLSPSYREDSLDGLPADIKLYLDAHYLPTLENLDQRNPKLLVVFAGGNAVGKTVLARSIGDELGAIILENDGIKRHLKAYIPGIERDELSSLTWKYSMDLYGRLDTMTENGLVVRDGVIHWYFDRILPLFKERGYEYFIIAYELSVEKRKELIRQRGDMPTTTADRLITIMADHEIHLKRFLEAHEPDIVLDDSTLFDHRTVIDKLRRRLAG